MAIHTNTGVEEWLHTICNIYATVSQELLRPDLGKHIEIMSIIFNEWENKNQESQMKSSLKPHIGVKKMVGS